jgi:hypothetical protein
VTRSGLALIALTAVALAACIPPRPSPTPTATSATASPVPSPDRTPSGIFPTAPASPAVAVDPALLHLLPDTVAGVPLEADEATAAQIASEESIAPFVSAIAVATAFGPPSTDTLPDYVVVTVARIKRGLFGDLFFRGWRDTFDAAVCGNADGVAGRAEAEIGGRQTFIGTCAGGVHTYHVYLPDQDVIVSLQGAGDGRFGERVVEGLTG